MDLLKKYLLSGVARAPDDPGGAAAGAVEGGQQQQQKQDAGSDAGGEQQEGDFVTLAEDDDDAEIRIGDDEDGDEDAGEGDENAEGEEGARKRPSGSKRLKARLARLERENQELRQGQAPRRVPAAGEDDDLKQPQEKDFPNDYLAFEAAMQDYRVRKAIRDENARLAKHDEQETAQRAHRATLSAYNDRLESVKDRIPDFDKVMADARGTEIRDDVLNQVLESAKGPLIAYHLAKNPDKVDALNRMSPLQAAREIGKLEARIRGPQVKKVTRAGAPIKTPKGGSAGASKTKNPAEMSMEEYSKARADGTIQ